MSNEKPVSRAGIESQLTEENARKAFDEYPKWVYHPDGRSQLVNSELEQSGMGEWLKSPQEAIDEKAKRDKRDSDKFIAKVAAEAAKK